MKAAYCTLGCKVNQYDTDTMKTLMEAAGYETVDFSDMADVYIINTCTVTATGDKKSRQMIARAHSLNPNACIAVTGCYSQTAPEVVSALPGVSVVLGTSDRSKIAESVEAFFKSNESRLLINDSLKKDFEDMSAIVENRTRAHLKIQEGCDRFCTYCIIPYARGSVRSRSLESTARELEKLKNDGFDEVVLTGIHIMSYGKDFKDGTNIIDVLKLAESSGIERIRLGSLEPEFISDDFVEFFASSKHICHQFHMSLQSGSDTVLKRMNRKYTSQQYENAVNKLREVDKNTAITTDIIVGFPNESEAEFAETLEFVKRIGFARVHIFPYSRRKGTPAYSMDGQLTRSEKEERVKRLMKTAAEVEEAYATNYIGKTVSVLVEECENDFAVGHTDTFMRVKVPCSSDLHGKTINVLIKGIVKDELIGVCLP